MKPSNVVKEIMKARGYNSRTLAEELAEKGIIKKPLATYVSNPLSRENGMRIDTFIDMVEAMGCEVVVRSKLSDKTKWVVDNGQE